MNVVYKYSNFQYNGIASLKPQKGEIVMFLAKYPDAIGSYHVVTMLNANVTTQLNITLSMVGSNPTSIELYDDPPTTGSGSDTWGWDTETFTGHFIWKTQPDFTDGCVIGPITFVDNYCIKAVLNQPNNAINRISIFSGNSSAPQRLLTVPYTSGSTFEFCQYPQTLIWKKDVTCPGQSNGAANVSIIGPTGYTFAWTNATGAPIGTGASISGLKAGQYYVTATDPSANKCNAARSVVISAPSAPSVTVTTTDFACSAHWGSASVVASGVGGFAYVWKKAGVVISGQTGSSISNLQVGDYSVTVSDSCGLVTTKDFTIDTVGCCGDGICQSDDERCTDNCVADCGLCCDVGDYLDNGVCKPCAPGSTTFEEGSTSCTPCPENSYSNGGSEVCLECPANTISAPGSGVCNNCPAGTFRARFTADGCETCGAGFVPGTCGNEGTCTACAAGTYAQDGWDRCQVCAAGYYSAAGASACTKCPADKYAASGSATCTACPPGTHTLVGAVAGNADFCN